MDQAEPYRDQRRQEHGLDLAKLVHPVIVGYDGSASARNALAYAAGTARRLGRPLLAVCVTSSGVHCELLAELDEIAIPAELGTHVRIRRSSPARELASLAAELSADALVIGAPAHFWHHLAGSVPGWLARHASCPVMVVPLGGLIRRFGAFFRDVRDDEFAGLEAAFPGHGGQFVTQ